MQVIKIIFCLIILFKELNSNGESVPRKIIIFIHLLFREIRQSRFLPSQSYLQHRQERMELK